MPDKDVVSIGVTGHRFLAELDRVVSGVDSALKIISQTYPSPRYHILSAIAEGADRIVADRGAEILSASLVAVLPMSLRDYLTDFESRSSREEFRRLLRSASQVIELQGSQNRSASYVNAGRYIADHSDILVAVWDGLPAQGRGGVGDIVAYCRSRGKPLVIVSAGNRKPGTEEPTTLGAAQGTVTCERLALSGGSA